MQQPVVPVGIYCFGIFGVDAALQVAQLIIFIMPLGTGRRSNGYGLVQFVIAYGYGSLPPGSPICVVLPLAS